MAIPAPFEVRLGTYHIDEEVLAARPKIWSLLGPRLQHILTTSLKRSAKYAPVWAPTIEKNFSRLLEMRHRHFTNLFTRPLDEAWVADAYAMVEYEAGISLDGRSRPTNARFLISEFAHLANKRYWFAPPKAAHLIDMATRMVMLDSATSTSCHKEIEVKKDKQDGMELIGAVEDYARTIKDIRESIIAVVASLGETSSELGSLAESAGNEANTATLAANDTAEHVGTTAAAAEELSASIVHIHGQATRSANMAHQSVAQADQTNATIRSLSDAVDKIGSVVGMISDIAAQTNLLALNATIEAARAGEAGRGFAVVASEVKLLATQTSRATEEIRQQIAVIQEATQRSVENIIGGGKTVSDIAAIAEAVAAAVDEQASSTTSIAASAARAASNAVTVADALKTVEKTVGKTQDSAKTVLGFSRELAGRTTDLDSAFTVLMDSASRRIASIKQFVTLK